MKKKLNAWAAGPYVPAAFVLALLLLGLGALQAANATAPANATDAARIALMQTAASIAMPELPTAGAMTLPLLQDSFAVFWSEYGGLLSLLVGLLVVIGLVSLIVLLRRGKDGMRLGPLFFVIDIHPKRVEGEKQ